MSSSSNPDQKRKASPVDSDVATFLRRVTADYARHGSDAPPSPVERRRIAEQVREPWRLGGPVMAETRDIDPTGVRLRLYRPVEQQDLPVLFYIHGGGWTMFSIETHDRLMREYAARAEVAVIGIDYSLAPEAKFPIALDEIDDAIAWLQGEGAKTLAIDASKMAIGGDSAGANLSVATCLRRRDRGQEALAGMLLNYGAFDPEPHPSYELYTGEDYALEVAEMHAFWDNYVTEPEELTNPLVAPLCADLGNLPPAFLAIAECDILADSNVAFATRLKEAGGTVRQEIYHGATHSFLEAISISPLAERAFEDQSSWLQQLLQAN